MTVRKRYSTMLYCYRSRDWEGALEAIDLCRSSEYRNGTFSRIQRHGPTLVVFAWSTILGQTEFDHPITRACSTRSRLRTRYYLSQPVGLCLWPKVSASLCRRLALLLAISDQETVDASCGVTLIGWSANCP